MGDKHGKKADRKSSSSFAEAMLDSQLAGTIKDSAQQIWLAGLGAFSKAQAEGAKAFDKLVKEGTTLQGRTMAAAEEKIVEAAGKVNALADEVKAETSRHLDKLESLFEARVAKALERLGMPPARDIEALARRIDALEADVEALKKKHGGRGTVGAKRTVKAARAVSAKRSATQAAAKSARKKGSSTRKA